MTVMTTYDGPATVATENTEHHVTAQLAITAAYGGLKEWTGTVTAKDEATAWEIFNADDTKLRIDDREGAFIAGAYNADTAELRIQGSGPAPFGT